ncbi:MAG: ribosome small subunit-dependent GTPase A [Planctomycetota bacterium]
MPRRPRNNNLTDQFKDGELSDHAADELGGPKQKYGRRSRHADTVKAKNTAEMFEKKRRAAADKLPLGRVVQVYSLFFDVESDTEEPHLCTARKTIQRVAETEIVVGDEVRFDKTGGTVKIPGADDDTPLRAEGVIEFVEPRRTVLMRTDPLDEAKQDPIVANAHGMLITVALLNPWPRWGLVDRMLIAAKAGGLDATVVLNKIDLDENGALADAREVLAHYRTLGVDSIECSAETGVGLDALRDHLAGKETVLAGHSGVGKSSLINAIDNTLDLRVGAVSDAHDKGMHTTTSARRLPLSFADGAVIDTPGVKVFGLWGVTPENLLETHFPDVADQRAPQWRVESYERVRESVTPKYD